MRLEEDPVHETLAIAWGREEVEMMVCLTKC